jgi:hypothetical protein
MEAAQVTTDEGRRAADAARAAEDGDELQTEDRLPACMPWGPAHWPTMTPEAQATEDAGDALRFCTDCNRSIHGAEIHHRGPLTLCPRCTLLRDTLAAESGPSLQAILTAIGLEVLDLAAKGAPHSPYDAFRAVADSVPDIGTAIDSEDARGARTEATRVAALAIRLIICLPGGGK